MTFPDAIPGFPEARRFVLQDLDEHGTFQLLQCVDIPELSLVVCVPWMFFPDYAPEIDEDVQRELALERAEDAIVFCSVTADAEEEALFLNLLGPLRRQRRHAAGPPGGPVRRRRAGARPGPPRRLMVGELIVVAS